MKSTTELQEAFSLAQGSTHQAAAVEVGALEPKVRNALRSIGFEPLRPERASGTSGTSTPELWQRFGQRDAEAAEQIYTAFAARQLGYAKRWLGDAHAAEDVVQEAFRVLLEKTQGRSEFQGLDGFFARIVHHVLMNTMRKKRPELVDPEVDGEALVLEEGRPLFTEFTERLFAERTTQEIARLADLVCNPFEREVLVLAVQGLTNGEIARELELTAKQVAKHKCLARQKLRPHLEPAQ